MPRDGSGVYSYPLGTEGIPDTTIESLKYNTYIADVQLDLNQPRPIVAGGTGASNAAVARQNIDAERAGQTVTNYDSHVWELGSFYSPATATAPPVADHAFAGIVYGDEDHMVITAFDLTTGLTSIRKQVDGVWESWTTSTGGDDKVDVAGDTMTGTLTINTYPNGHLKLNNTDPGATSGSNNIRGEKNGVGQWEMRIGDGTGRFKLNNLTTLGTVIDISPAGVTKFSNGVQIQPATSAAGLTLTAPSSLMDIIFNTPSGTTWGAVEASSSSISLIHQSGGNVYLKAGGVNVWEARAGTVVAAYSDAYKPGGGMWLSSTSDARTKNVLGEYDSGLAEVCALQPVRYKYKGNDKMAAEDKFSQTQHVKNQEFIGLIAQDVERVMPEMVLKRKGFIDEKPVEDMRTVDSSALIYALVNAVRELSQRLEELEEKVV